MPTLSTFPSRSNCWYSLKGITAIWLAVEMKYWIRKTARIVAIAYPMLKRTLLFMSCTPMSKPSRCPRKQSGRERHSVPAHSLLLAVDGDPPDFFLGRRRLRQRHGKDAVLERRGDLISFHVIDRNAALEAAVVALGEATLLVLGFALFLAADAQEAVSQFDVDILLFQPGKFGGH